MTLELTPQTKLLILRVCLNKRIFDVSLVENPLSLSIVKDDFLFPCDDESIVVKLDQVVK